MSDYAWKNGQKAANNGNAAPDTRGMSNAEAQKAQEAFRQQKEKNDSKSK